MYSYFSILSYTHNSLLIFCSSMYILPSSRTSSSIKNTTCNSRFFFTCRATRYWGCANVTCRIPRSMRINASGFTGKDNNEIASCMYSFFLFWYNFEFLLGLLYFQREVFDIMYEDLLYGFYNFPFTFSGKVWVILILLFFSFILSMPTRLFLSVANKKSFKSKNSVERKYCQLKRLKVLLMHLFVTLLINKTIGSDNRHFFFNTLEKENKEEFLIYSTFCTLAQIEKKCYWIDCPRMHYPKFI